MFIFYLDYSHSHSFQHPRFRCLGITEKSISLHTYTNYFIFYYSLLFTYTKSEEVGGEPKIYERLRPDSI